jgi:hypothetical protein
LSDISQIAGALVVAISAIWLPGVLIIKAADRFRPKSERESSPPEA